MPAAQMTVDERYLDKRAVARLLGRSVRHVERLAARGRRGFPASIIRGGRRVWVAALVRDWANQRSTA
jgi:predicted DNA-binding transcriptional regulator AlpA